ncbi:MAG: UDP-N-acetylglucosamine 2-epimerase (non-hydrolyzing) [Alphaproteobacteria bacterium]|nr:UDP-N-acetylglucosamine 2-epimerase (non-hydrolyzing) [Alphaproteobacteria bacterium]
MSPVLAVVLGTRPEAIKMVPVIAGLRAHPEVVTRVVVSGQHDLSALLDAAGVSVDAHIDAPPAGTLAEGLARATVGVEAVLAADPVDGVVVHGDTTTALGAALAAHYCRVPVAHVEAGLRTHDLWSPWPEEAHRAAIDRLSDLLLAPTEGARALLLAEGADPARIVVTGNPAVDAVRATAARVARRPLASVPGLEALPGVLDGRRLVVWTTHRRENLGPPLRALALAARDVLDARPDVVVAVPVHPNPRVGPVLREVLGDHPRAVLLPPLQHEAFVRLVLASTLVATDSGGVQEEAPSLGRRVVVLRDTTERPEGVAAGLARVAGVTRDGVRQAVLDDLERGLLPDEVVNPYGDGTAGVAIARALAAWVAQSVVDGARGTGQGGA